MYRQEIALMASLFAFLGAPFFLLAVWQKGRSSLLPWKSLPLCCLLVCGAAFAAAFFLASATDAAYHALGRAFQLDRESAATAARAVVGGTAVLAASLCGLWVVKKISRSMTSGARR